jgi:hypothetical protein
MRYLFGFLCVCALAGNLSLSASAQDTEARTTSEPNLEQPAASSEPAPEEPALQLKLDDAGVDVVPSPSRTIDGYTLEEMELRVKRARIGLGVSALSTVVGIALSSVAWGNSICFLGDCSVESWVAPVGYTGAALVAGGVAGMTASGILLRRRKRDRDSLRAAHYGTPRRAQWDLAQSRLVF